MNRRRLIIITASIILIGGVIFLVIKNSADNTLPTKSVVKLGETVTPVNANGAKPSPSTKPTPPSTTDLADTIKSGAPTLVDANGQTKFGITKVVEPIAGWFVVTISISGSGEPNKVVIKQTNSLNNPLTIVAGPGTSFPPEYITVPDAVRKLL